MELFSSIIDIWDKIFKSGLSKFFKGLVCSWILCPIWQGLKYTTKAYEDFATTKGFISSKFYYSFLLFFLFLSLFSLKYIFDSQDSREQRGNHYFSCFSFPTAHEYSFGSMRCLTLILNRSICDYQSDSWWDMFSVEICIFFSLMQSSRSYWLSYFKVTLWEFELISNYPPSITNPTA